MTMLLTIFLLFEGCLSWTNTHIIHTLRMDSPKLLPSFFREHPHPECHCIIHTHSKIPARKYH